MITTEYTEVTEKSNHKMDSPVSATSVYSVVKLYQWTID